MAIEIERKFLVVGEAWRRGATVKPIEQGYLFSSPMVSARIRLVDGTATLTLKGERAGLARDEFEYAIPIADARDLMRLSQHPPIVKLRHEVVYAGKLWEVDEFTGRHAGLVIAEIELDHADEVFERPSWLGQEVTHDRRYRNSALIASGIPGEQAA
ncbi:CYTH domain-containing protein [Phreatobacter stygius]|uniref:CYTH domain-containing protein n=1 Tax=Phreatobacter stygius TaxID=1940610 RepID=A0A4D7BBA6_9HYPH|nr:CYTH domain-containing protein [Phreatobacter stygius]QCI66726.1 CYTH domain-containing protein [Phreatobacter stygius]